MSMTIIAAVAQNSVIGNSKTNKMPWHIPSELAFFKRRTLGKRLIMGRKTAESVGPLKMRRNFVLTENHRDEIPYGFQPIALMDAIRMSKNAVNSLLDGDNSEVMICGGAQVYEVLMPYCDEMVISRLPFEAEGDVMFPEIDMDIWKIDLRESFDEFSVERYVRK